MAAEKRSPYITTLATYLDAYTHREDTQHLGMSVREHMQCLQLKKKKPSQPTIPINRTVMDGSGIGF